ncbi:hypothetical protein [Lysinibacillus xylanilyticus]|uniref:hypothetical protein n=1 Tax=Lysinibacillus xylanilyticus TaxID=582475 RepID=UPI003CFCD9B3
MGDRLKKLEERIGKRKYRIEKLHYSMKEEKSKLKKDEETLMHLKYDEVLKRMQETGVNPDEALRAIDNELEKSQSDDNQGGVQNHGNNY